LKNELWAFTRSNMCYIDDKMTKRKVFFENCSLLFSVKEKPEQND